MFAKLGEVPVPDQNFIITDTHGFSNLNGISFHAASYIVES